MIKKLSSVFIVYYMIYVPLDNVIVISLFFSVFGTFYFCSKYLNEENSEQIVKENKLKNSPKSFSDFSIFLSEDQMLPLLDESKDYSKSCSAIQNSKSCSKCYIKLNSSESMNYFAFDKQYCKYCWQMINYKISKTY